MSTAEVDERFMYVRSEPYHSTEFVNVRELAEWLDNESDSGQALLDCLFEYLLTVHGTPSLLDRFARAVERADLAELEERTGVALHRK